MRESEGFSLRRRRRLRPDNYDSDDYGWSSAATVGFREADRYHRRQQQRTQLRLGGLLDYRTPGHRLKKRQPRRQYKIKQQQTAIVEQQKQENFIVFEKEQQQIQQYPVENRQKLLLESDSSSLPFVLGAFVGLALTVGVVVVLASLRRAKPPARNFVYRKCCCCWYWLCRSGRLPPKKRGPSQRQEPAANGRPVQAYAGPDSLPQVRISSSAWSLASRGPAADERPALLTYYGMPNIICDTTSLGYGAPKCAPNASAALCAILSTPPTPTAAVACIISGAKSNLRHGIDDGNSRSLSDDNENNDAIVADRRNARRASGAVHSALAPRSSGAVARGRHAIGRLLKKLSFSVFPAAENSDGHSNSFFPYDDDYDEDYSSCFGYSTNGSSRLESGLDRFDHGSEPLPYAAYYGKGTATRLSVASDQGAPSWRHYSSVGGRLKAWVGGKRPLSKPSPRDGRPACGALLSPGDALFFSQRRATRETIGSRSIRCSPQTGMSPTTQWRQNNGNRHTRPSNNNGSYANFNNSNNNSHPNKRTRISACGCDAKRQLAFGYGYCCNAPHVAARPRATSSVHVQSPPASPGQPSAIAADPARGEIGEGGRMGQRSSSFYARGALSALSSGSLNVLSRNNGDVQRAGVGTSVFNFGKLNSAFKDDREFDNCSVMHYELGFYEKTFAATDCFRGTLTFQLRYDFIHRALMLHVMRASNLPFTDGPPDPYVKMYCLPERRHYGKTRIFKHTSDADFNEVFSFDVTYFQLADRMLQFTVYNYDRFTRHGLIGNVIMRDVFEKSELYNWTEYTMQIVGSQEKNDFGDLLIYLVYSVQLRRLFVTVSKAYNLRPMDITGASDPYVKVEQIYHGRRLKMRKTSIKRANLNPVYHECLEFDVPPDELEETNLLFQVVDWDRIGRDDLLGCCVLGRDSTTHPGRQQWEQLCHTVLRCFGSPTGGWSPPPPAAAEFRDESTAEHDSSEQCADGNDAPTAALPPCRVAQKLNSIPPAVIDQQRTRAISAWHSILGEVPERFRNIPKAKK